MHIFTGYWRVWRCWCIRCQLQASQGHSLWTTWPCINEDYCLCYNKQSCRSAHVWWWCTWDNSGLHELMHLCLPFLFRSQLGSWMYTFYDRELQLLLRLAWQSKILMALLAFTQHLQRNSSRWGMRLEKFGEVLQIRSTMPSWNKIVPWHTGIFTGKILFFRIVCFLLELLLLLVFYMIHYTFCPCNCR